MIILVTESTDGIELTGSGVVISVLEGIFEGGGGGVSDHGALTGLGDDDHAQYHTDARGDARYWALSTDLATQAELDTHAADTTSVHGIADTSVLATDTEVATAVSDHAAAANPHPTYLTQAEGDAAYDSLGAAAAAQSAAATDATTKVSTHEADTTSVHGIADTSVLATATSVATAVSNHAAAADPHTGYLKESDYDANTILAATSDNTPVALTVAASRILGRKASGDISAMTAAELWALLAAGTGHPEVIGVALSDETTAITTGTAKATIRMPFAMTLTAVRANLNTVSSSGIPTVDINEAGTTILSTKLTIDASEFTSTTAATAAVISDANLADDAEITFDIDVAGTGAKGLKVWLIGTRA